MNGKKVFVIALMAVISGVYGVIDILRPAVSEATANLPQAPALQYVTLWRSNTDLAKGMAITPAQVVREQVELQEAAALGFKSDVKLDFSPTVLLNSPIKKGEWIWEEYQTKPGEPGYIDLMITEGMTLFPLQVSAKNLITNFIHPGDYVDILSISSPKINLATVKEVLPYFAGTEATIFLHHVKVMSIASGSKQIFSKNDIGENVNAQHAVNNEQKMTVVLEVKPSDIARLSLAQRAMHIEMYRSYEYQSPLHADLRSIINNYTDVEELRGSSKVSSNLADESHDGDDGILSIEKLLGYKEER